MLMVSPSGGDDGDPRVPTINVKNIGSAPPLDGAAGDLGAPVINSKKRRWWAPLGGGVRDLGACNTPCN
jgi:hypothetical protein